MWLDMKLTVRFITFSRAGGQSFERAKETGRQADAHRDSSHRGSHLPRAPEYSEM